MNKGLILLALALGVLFLAMRRTTKFVVGQRVAQVNNLAQQGTVIQVQPLIPPGEQTYIVQFDNVAGPTPIGESLLVAI